MSAQLIVVALGGVQNLGQALSFWAGRVYADSPFSVPAEEEIEPWLRAQLLEWCHELPAELPLGVTVVFVSCWIRLYGMVSVEVLGRLRFALADAEPMFEAELRTMAVKLGIASAYAVTLLRAAPHS